MSIKKFILTRAIGAAGEKIDGYKMKGAGVALILLALAGFIHLLWPELPGLPDLTPTECWYSAVAGVGVIGGAGKGAKIEKALKLLAGFDEKKKKK